MSIVCKPFGVAPDGTPVCLYSWENAHGYRIEVSDYGARILVLETPDREGRKADVLLGFDRPEDMLADQASIGALIGRVANRTESPVNIGGVSYDLDLSEGVVAQLHGGLAGWGLRVWEAEAGVSEGQDCLSLSLRGAAGESGLPGNVDVTVKYRYDENDRLIVDFMASTDAVTVVNMTQHMYFNLIGNAEKSVLGHIARINASSYAETDENLVFKGRVSSVAGTPLDFRGPHSFGERIGANAPSLKFGGGYDLNYFVDGFQPGVLSIMAEVWEPESGRMLTVSGTQPCVQLYTGNMLQGIERGKRDLVYRSRVGFCLETQHVPNAPVYEPESVTLRPGERYCHRAVYAFGIRE